MDGRYRNLKQLQQTIARCLPCTVESVQPTPASSITNLLAKTLTTPLREGALRLFQISTTVVKESSSRTLSVRCTTPRPVLGGTVRGQRSGATGGTGDAPDGPGHAPTIPRSVPPNRFTSVTSMVWLNCPNSKHPSCVRSRVPLPRQQTPLLCLGSYSISSNRVCARTLPLQ